MSQRVMVKEKEESASKSTHHLMWVRTEEPMEFIDLTDRIQAVVRESGITFGMINLQTLHTTTAIVVNECEPLLHGDMKRLLEHLAPAEADYEHDNLTIRTVNLVPDERRNGHSHCRAMFFRTSETLNIVDGELRLGRWQRIFLLELDGPQERRISALLMGSTE